MGGGCRGRASPTGAVDETVQCIDTGVPVRNEVANVAMIDQDLTELVVNIGTVSRRMCQRRTLTFYLLI